MRLSKQAALAVALTLGLVAVLLGYFYLRAQQPSAEVVRQVQLPVPIKDIPADTDLKKEMFKQASFDPAQVSSDAIVDPGMLHGRITIKPLSMNQPVQASAVAMRSTSLALAYGIPEGLRAVAVPVDEIAGVGNFIRPGDRVDLMVLFTDSSGEYSVVHTVLQNIEILAVNQATVPYIGEGEEEGTKPAARRDRKTSTATLAVTPRQAQLLALSDVRGNVRLTLRRTGDNKIETLARSQSWTLIGSFPKENAQKPGAPGTETVSPQPPSWAQMWGTPPGQQPPLGSKPGVKGPAEKSGIEVIRGSSREFVTPRD